MTSITELKKIAAARAMTEQTGVGVRWNVRYSCYEIDTELRTYTTLRGLRAAIRRHTQSLRIQAERARSIGPQSGF